MFISKVKNIMKNQGKTYAEMTLKTGLSDKTISKARTDAGIAECRLSTLKRIADYLGVPVKELFEEKNG